MGPYYVARLTRPYDFRVLIEAYIYTKRSFVHPDFETYYKSLLETLEGLFGVRLSRDALPSSPQRVLWFRFESTVASLLRITTPWDGCMEDGLLNCKLQEIGELGEAVYRASDVIHEATTASEAAHREILYALFIAIFGECQRVITSEELRQAGFDDSREPDMVNYYQYT